MILSVILSFVLGFLSPSNTLELEIQNIPSSKGNIMIAIFDNPNGFPSSEKMMISKVVKAEKGSMKIKIELPKTGNYAIAVYHDVNSNEELDTNLFGVPTEYYGFSKNARGTFSAPSFKEAQIEVKGNTSTSIKLL